MVSNSSYFKEGQLDWSFFFVQISSMRTLTPPENRRRYRRVEMPLLVTYYLDEREYVDYTLDVSGRGVFICSQEVIQMGQRIDIHIVSRDLMDVISTTGTVVRTSAKGFALDLSMLSEGETRTLDQMVQKVASKREAAIFEM